MRNTLPESRAAIEWPYAGGRLWPYTALPAIVLNLGAVLIFVPYYALRSVRPDLVAGIAASQVNLAAYAIVVVVEWSLAIAVMAGLRQSGRPLRSLLAPDGSFLRFRLAPAALVFVGLNALFGAYVAAYQLFFGGWPRLNGTALWERLALLTILPLTAAYCEELIWRGKVLTLELARGRRVGKAIVIGAVWFSLIHGVFLPDKLLVTFVWGLLAGIYYLRERNLLPLMAAHLVTDLWSYALAAL
jgi:membrane protease YdiL (CAAX protease family)